MVSTGFKLRTIVANYYSEPVSPLSRWIAFMDELEREDKTRLKFTWIPAKVIPTPVFIPKKRYQKTFTGMKFRVGGSKK